MKPTSCYPLSAAGARDRKRMRQTPMLRLAPLIFVACASSACTEQDVVMENPHTGKTEVCGQSLQGLDPWSQTMACVTAHEVQGWVRATRE